jgi:hypothetical protein
MVRKRLGACQVVRQVPPADAQTDPESVYPSHADGSLDEQALADFSGKHCTTEACFADRYHAGQLTKRQVRAGGFIPWS